jgi:hypothetical protein
LLRALCVLCQERAPSGVDPTARFAWVLALLFVINVSGFFMEALRLAVVKPSWAAWSPVGYVLGQRQCWPPGLTESSLRGLHLGTWLFHAVLSLGFIAVIPFSYFHHLRSRSISHFMQTTFRLTR